MSGFLIRLPAWLPSYAPVALAFLVAAAGSWALRRWSGLPAFGAAVAAAVGWAGLVPLPWRWIVWPRGTLEFLVLPALVFALADVVRLRVRSRWIGVAAVCFAAWWLANAPMARVQFWRVGFGALLVTWLLGRVGATEPRMAMGVALTAWCGLLVGGATANWDVALAIMVVVSAGVWLGRRDGAVPAGLSMVGLAGAELGGGHLMRAGVGAVDVACVAAIGAPLLIPGVEAWLRPRLGQAARIAGVVGTGLGLAGFSWVLSRAIRG